MKKHSTRRFFIRNTLMATLGCSVLPTMAFKSNAKEKLASSALNSNSELGALLNKEVIVNGTIYDKAGSATRNDVLIEVWHLSPHTQKYEYYKNIRTDRNGEYQFTSVLPQKEPGKMPKFHFKIVTKERSYQTELMVNDFGAYITDKHWVLNKQLGDNLFPGFSPGKAVSHVKFNLSV